MTKIGSITLINGYNTDIYYDQKAKSNPYIIKQKTFSVERYGDGKSDWRYVPHTVTVEKFANLSSCTAWIHDYVLEHDEDGRNH